MVFVWRASAGCLVFAHAVGLCNDLSANSILAAGKVQLLSEEHHLAVLLVPVRAKWHLCGGFVGGGLSRVVPSRTAVLPPASGYGLPLPILSPNPAFPTSPSCSQWLWAAYCPDWCCGSWWRSWLQLQALAPSHRACPSFWWQAARRGVAMVGLCPAGGRAAVPLLAEAVPQHWAGVWLWTAVGSVLLFLQSPAFLCRAEQLLGTEQDRAPHAFWPQNACAYCFILLGRNLLGFFFSKKVKTSKIYTSNKLTLVLSMLYPLKHLKTLD